MTRCHCFDPACPAHPKKSCAKVNVRTEVVYRIDMADLHGTEMCHPCAIDAINSGLFTTEPR